MNRFLLAASIVLFGWCHAADAPPMDERTPSIISAGEGDSIEQARQLVALSLEVIVVMHCISLNFYRLYLGVVNR